MLRQHPNVHVNPVKEARYFYEASVSSGTGLVGQFLGQEWFNKAYRSTLKKRIRTYLKHPVEAARSRERVAWDCKYFFGRRSDKWFEGLFGNDTTKLSGDFTPQTYRIPSEHIFRISREWPAMKVMLTFRDPVDWMTSIAKMWPLEDMGPSAVTDAVRAYAQLYPYPNLQIISAWEEAFAGRLELLFFDDFCADPERFLVHVCKFLDLSIEPIPGFKGLDQKEYASPSVALPPCFRRVLQQFYRAQVEQLATRFEGYPRQWLKRYQG
jgi:hypothetical protein